jgi:hypothetical protein
LFSENVLYQHVANAHPDCSLSVAFSYALFKPTPSHITIAAHIQQWRALPQPLLSGNRFDERELAAIRKGRAQVLEISPPRADTPPHTN